MRRRLALLLALLLVGAATARSVTVATTAQPDTLDPHVTSATSAFQSTKSIYDTLVEVARDGAIVPSLAASYTTSLDGLTWTFALREGIRFHDGTLLDAADVVASLERLAAEGSPKRDEFTMIEAIAAPDAATVVLTLSAPAPALLASLASGWGAILPSEKLASGHDFGNQPVGTGPFVFVEWVRDAYLRLITNPDYFQGTPVIDGVTLRFVADSAVQLQGLRSGEFDLATGISPVDFDVVRADPALELVQGPSGTVLVATLNNRRPYLDDARVRRALNLAIDAETVLEVAYGGGIPGATFMESGSPWLPDFLEPYGYDPEQARALLASAGVPDDWTIDLALPQPYEVHVTAGQIIQDMLRDVGVNAEIRVVEWGVWLGEVYGGPRDFDMTVIGHTGKLDPTGRLNGYGHADRTYSGYDNLEVAGWIDRAAVTSEPATRASLYAQALTRMHDDAPFAYLGTALSTHARTAAVEGFWVTPLLDTYDFRSVTVR
ncbi:MAG: ABC transporter substrate-binding protein [Trueperaceae bacterium]|nr:ABC transporter substrate-binding protein [Trueperaceae bacterium]